MEVEKKQPALLFYMYTLVGILGIMFFLLAVLLFIYQNLNNDGTTSLGTHIFYIGKK